MKEKILQVVDAYWKFDNQQQPISSWHDKQDLLKALEELLQPDVINCVAFPEWLTDEIRAKAKQTWNEHKVTDDRKRVEAMLIIKESAEGWHDGSCCCNCKNQIELFKHPWNKVNKGSIMESTGMYACIVQFDCDKEYKGIIFEKKHGMCEMHVRR